MQLSMECGPPGSPQAKSVWSVTFSPKEGGRDSPTEGTARSSKDSVLFASAKMLWGVNAYEIYAENCGHPGWNVRSSILIPPSQQQFIMVLLRIAILK